MPIYSNSKQHVSSEKRVRNEGGQLRNNLSGWNFFLPNLISPSSSALKSEELRRSECLGLLLKLDNWRTL